ncbi:MAG TPA: VWA domain-containing protein, partial [Thermoanaerobaculia bacterium]|nr:VWA domain-containing protein [Thermoanaerobaculia bacterium]
PCARCRDFLRDSVPHPAIQRRLPNVVFAVQPASESGVAFFDRGGTLRARWPIVPDTTNFGVLLDSIVAVAPHFERAMQLAERGATEASDFDIATGLTNLGFHAAARTTLERVQSRGNPEWQPAATVALAMLDVREGHADRALARLEPIAANPEAARAIESIRRLRAPREPDAARVIRILPLERQVVSGRNVVKTHVASAGVARVVFSLDQRTIARVVRPPFSATLDFGSVAERHAIGVVAFDGKGKELGRDERVVNEAGETFWLRLVEPRSGDTAGRVRVAMNVRESALHRVQRVVISWNDAERAVLTSAPWESAITIPAEQVGVLRAVAELDDGRTAEDAVLLNGGFMARADVQLVEVPLTILGREDKLTPDQIVVHEGNITRRVESIATADETPLTVGLLIDASGSMQASLPDVQEAAIRFLDAVLRERDRAFVVMFDSRAQLVQPATSDKELLRRRVLSIRPEGLTAIHDAIALGLLQFEGVKGRRALIVFSDGLDVASRYTASDVMELAKHANVPIHIIAPPLPRTATASAPVDTLERIARSMGGTFHPLTDLAQLGAIYTRIETALRAQILAFLRTDPATKENEWRPMRVEVKGAPVEIFAPEGYYARW